MDSDGSTQSVTELCSSLRIGLGVLDACAAALLYCLQVMHLILSIAQIVPAIRISRLNLIPGACAGRDA